MLPQGVSKRYISNLLQYGRNREFDILKITIHDSIEDGYSVGRYFFVRIDIANATDTSAKDAVGGTISQAVERALIKHGVTFVVK